jgi:hypothetical protein
MDHALQSAVDAAADGDVVLVKASARYSAGFVYFRLQGKSLTVIADTAADVRIVAATIQDLTASQRVVLRGLKFEPSFESLCYGPRPALKLLNNQGLVWIEDCEVPGLTSLFCETVPGILVDRCDNVVLLRTSSGGGGVMYDSHMEDGQNEGFGLVLEGDSRVAAHGCAFQGADGYPGTFYGVVRAGAPGLYSESSGDRVFLSDCQVTGGDGIYWDDDIPLCSRGGPGISSAGVTWMFDSLAMGGSGGSGPGCSAPSGRPALGNVQSIPGQALRFSVVAPVRERADYQIDFLGPPNTPVWFFFGSSPIDRFRLMGPLLRGQSFVSFAGTTNAAGALQVTRSMPAMAPGIEFGRLFAQGFYLAPHGRFVLGGASMFLALDQSF